MDAAKRPRHPRPTRRRASDCASVPRPIFFFFFFFPRLAPTRHRLGPIRAESRRLGPYRAKPPIQAEIQRLLRTVSVRNSLFFVFFFFFASSSSSLLRLLEWVLSFSSCFFWKSSVYFDKNNLKKLKSFILFSVALTLLWPNTESHIYPFFFFFFNGKLHLF